ncbi:hypothetical protein MVEN_00926100 [Mycena venus]|uniref:Transmembrane protein n=1 Tax=Mycena venus TaxID=2733690 RepID=A0A8H6YBA1_9AGAR|nr:hypothetical protein MVEN_00926100 [Mycena venus]
MSQPSVLQGLASDPPSLPPDLAGELHVASYVFAGASAVFIWDILHNLVDDYSILCKLKFQMSAVVYLMSRIACLVYIIGFTLFATYPLSDCHAAMVAFNSFYPISSCSTALLFFFRVRAIYNGRRAITLSFGLLWLCMVGGAITIPVSSSAVKIGSSCVVTGLPTYVGANGLAMTVYDTSVFLAISYRLLANSRVEQSITPRETVRALFSGADLYAFSRSLFRDGQKYYLITIFTNALTLAMVYAPDINPVYRGMGAIPNIALTNIMACRVYRNVKLHYVHGVPRAHVALRDQQQRLGRRRREGHRPRDVHVQCADARGGVVCAECCGPESAVRGGH